MHVLPGLGGGTTECLAANLALTLGQGRIEAGLLGLLDPAFGTGSEEPLVQEGTTVWRLSKRQVFDPQTFLHLVRILERDGLHGGPALSLHVRKLAKRAPSLAEREGPR